MRRPSTTLGALLFLVAACTPAKNPDRQDKTLSTVPCAENCGGDRQCLDHCQYVTNGPNAPAPPAVAPFSHR